MFATFICLFVMEVNGVTGGYKNIFYKEIRKFLSKVFFKKCRAKRIISSYNIYKIVTKRRNTFNCT